MELKLLGPETMIAGWFWAAGTGSKPTAPAPAPHQPTEQHSSCSHPPSTHAGCRALSAPRRSALKGQGLSCPAAAPLRTLSVGNRLTESMMRVPGPSKRIARRAVESAGAGGRSQARGCVVGWVRCAGGRAAAGR